MPNVINGVAGGYQQPLIYGVTESGPYLIVTYQGTRAEVASLQNFVIGLGGTFEIQESFSGAADKLVARYPYNTGQAEIPVDDWEIFANSVPKDILESDLPVITRLSDDDKKLIIKYVENSDLNVSPALSTSEAIDLFLEMKAGLRDVEISQPTIRWTRTVSKNYPLGVVLPTIIPNRAIMSTSSMIGNLPIPQQVQDQMPNYSNPVYADGRIRFYGWKKEHATIRVGLHQKTQLVQEWVYGLWAGVAYGPPV